MKAFLILLSAFPVVGSAQPSSSTDYDIVVSATDAGNGASASPSYAITQSSLGGFIGVSCSSNYAVGSGVVATDSILPLPLGIDLTSYPSWASQFPTFTGPNTDPEDDFDGDQITNQDEFLALTDPTDASSKLEFSLVTLDSVANTAIFRVSPHLNKPALRVYTLLSQDETITANGYTPTGLTANAEGEFTDLRVIIAKRFYRIRITIPPQS